MSLIDEQGPAGTVFPGPSGISGGTTVPVAAPVGASYLVAMSESGLTAERALAVSSPMTLSDGGPGGTLTLGAAAVPTPDHLDYPGQSVSIPSAVLAAAVPDGVYMLVATVDVSAAAAAGTISAEAQCTDNGARTATAFSGFTLAATGTMAGSVPFRHTGGDITVTTTVVGLIGVPTYEAKFRLVRLG